MSDLSTAADVESVSLDPTPPSAEPVADTATPQSGETPVPDPKADAVVALDDLPASWQKEIKDLRAEAARYRTANKAQADPEAAGLRDRLAALETQLAEKTAAELAARESAEKTQILASRGIDPKFLPMLSGADAEAWGKAADALVELRGAKGISPDPAQVAASNNQHTKSDRDQQAEEFFAPLGG